MDNKTNILKKLATIQEKLKAPKNQWNKFGKFNYRSAEDILEAVKPLLKETKTVLLLGDKIEEQNGRYYVLAEAKLICVETGDQLSNTALAREAENKAGMDTSQITGTASSYARKYALNGLFLIDDTKDADTDEYALNSGQTANRQQKSNTITDKQQKLLYARTKEYNLTAKQMKSLLGEYGYQKSTEIEQKNFNTILDKMEILRQEQEQEVNR